MRPSSSPNPPSPVGRRRALDDIKLGEICALISVGSGLEDAARYVGCAASTIRREARRNPGFNEKVRRAHPSAELGPLKALREAALKDWRAATWLLERMNPQRFAKQNARHVTPDQLRAFTDLMANLLLKEVPDRNKRRRILRRLQKFIKQTEVEMEAAKFAAFPQRSNRHRAHS